MIFTETELKGAFVVGIEPIEDERGFFARSWCRNEFEEHGLNHDLVQCNISFNNIKGTLRGMHYQISPHQEAKLIRCTLGSIYDVIIDLREESQTFKKWIGLELRASGHDMLYVPEGFAHGFLTLENNSEVFYQMSDFFHPESARGIRWDDPGFAIKWTDEINLISERDKTYPDFDL